MFTSGFEKAAEEKKKSPSIGEAALIGGAATGATTGSMAAHAALKDFARHAEVGNIRRLLREIHADGDKIPLAKHIGKISGKYALRGAATGAGIGAGLGAIRKYLHSKKEPKTAS